MDKSTKTDFYCSCVQAIPQEWRSWRPNLTNLFRWTRWSRGVVYRVVVQELSGGTGVVSMAAPSMEIRLQWKQGANLIEGQRAEDRRGSKGFSFSLRRSLNPQSRNSRVRVVRRLQNVNHPLPQGQRAIHLQLWPPAAPHCLREMANKSARGRLLFRGSIVE